MVDARTIDWTGSGPEVDCVTLRGGVTVTRAALHLALDLEIRGVVLRLEDGRLLARPRDLLTADDLAALKEHRDDIKRIVAYEAPPL